MNSVDEQIESKEDEVSNEIVLTTIGAALVGAAITGGLSATKAALGVGALAVVGLVTKNLSDPNRYKDMKKGSLIEYTKSTRVEPVVLFDETLRMQPYISDIFQSLVNIFCGYYLQAVAISANIGNIEVQKILGKLSTDRDDDRNVGRAASTFAEAITQTVSSASGVEKYNNLKVDNILTAKYLQSVNIAIANEAISQDEKDEETRKEWERKKEKSDREKREDRRRERKDTEDNKSRTERETREKEENIRRRNKATREREESDYRKTRDVLDDERKDDERDYKRERDRDEDERRSRTSMGASRGSIEDLNTNANLSVGKTISFDIESDGRKASIPINVRLIVKEINPLALTSFLTVLKDDRKLRTRIKKWKSGEIEFFRDLVLCQDIIDEERNAHFHDKEGIFRKLRERNRKNKNTAMDLAVGDVNVATASSIIVISADTARKVERELMGKLDNFRTREGLFKITFTMIMLVVDTQWEKVIMYHRSIEEPSILSVKDFKIRGRDSGPDINEILTAYRAGTAPTF